jgi:outer membrane murein-binding lipoprotein Lpp
MKSVASLLFAAALIAGCQNESKLDGSGGGGGDLAARVKKLEETNAKYAEALEFLQKVYGQQKQQQVQQEREEPDPTAMFAVDVAPNIAGGLVEGPATGAPVTIVEAWDFA